MILRPMTDTSLAVLFSLANAVTVSTFSLFVRRGERHANAVTGVLIGLLVSLPVMAAATAWLWEPGWWNPWAFALFAAAGVVGPSLGRVLYFQAIHRLGVARAVPLTSIMPLVAAVMGVALLGERPGAAGLAGTVLVVLGCAAITSRRSAGSPWDRRHMWIPFASVAAFSFSHLFRKMGVTAVPSPLLGLTVMSLAGAACLYLLGRFLPAPHRPDLRPGRAWVVYGLTGLLNNVSVLLHFYGLRYGDLTIVVPLSSTSPLFSLLLSWLFLRDLERVTAGIVAGTAFVVLGGILITWRAL